MKQQNPQRRSDYELDERAAEAAFLLNHVLFKEAMSTLQERYIAQISASKVGSDDLLSAHAKLKVLSEFYEHFRQIVTDKQMADKKGVNYGR
jgi:hypothetical protein